MAPLPPQRGRQGDSIRHSRSDQPLRRPPRRQPINSAASSEMTSIKSDSARSSSLSTSMSSIRGGGVSRSQQQGSEPLPVLIRRVRSLVRDIREDTEASLRRNQKRSWRSKPSMCTEDDMLFFSGCQYLQTNAVSLFHGATQMEFRYRFIIALNEITYSQPPNYQSDQISIGIFILCMRLRSKA